MTYHTPNTATAAVPDAAGLPAQRWKTPAASNLPQADAAAFIQPSCEASEPLAAPTRTAITSGSPDDAERGFSSMMDRVAVELAAVEHERLCEASAERFGYAGVVGLRDKRQKALHARLRAELDAGKGV